MAGLLEFAAQFGTEERCIEHLAELRWPGGFVCAGCGGRQAWRLKARPRVYECTACHRQASVTLRYRDDDESDTRLSDIQCLIVGAEPQLLIVDGPSQELPLDAPPSPRDSRSMGGY